MLQGFLRSLGERLAECELENGTIDEWVAELERITREDTYVVQRPTQFKSELIVLRNTYPNREAAAGAIAYFRYRKADNELRKMPLDERVPRMMDSIEGRHSFGSGTSLYLEGELIRLGEDALRLIVKRAPTGGPSAEQYIRITRGIGGLEAVKYLMRVSKDQANESWVRCDALTAASTLTGAQVIMPELTEFLRDNTVERGSRCRSQRSFDDSDHEPCQYELFPLRSCAAAALTQITEKNWGPIFNEDYRTWKAWHDAPGPDKFHPFMLARSDSELKDLAIAVLNRALDNRFGPWESPCGRSEAQMVGEQLRELGPYGLSALVEYFQSRAPSLKRETALENLKEWTASVLGAIATPEARAAQDAVYDYHLPESAP